MTPDRDYTHGRPPRSNRRWGTAIAAALLAVAACAPGGPSSSELAATEAFAATMPGSVEVGRGGNDPWSGFEGSFNGYAWRMLVADGDEAAVLAWHRTALESDGWTPTSHGFIWMQDGRSTRHAWRRGDLVMGLGFPRRGHLRRSYPAGTVYELTITYEPEDS